MYKEYVYVFDYEKYIMLGVLFLLVNCLMNWRNGL